MITLNLQYFGGRGGAGGKRTGAEKEDILSMENTAKARA